MFTPTSTTFKTGSTCAIPAFMCPVKNPTVGGDLAASQHAQEER